LNFSLPELRGWWRLNVRPKEACRRNCSAFDRHNRKSFQVPIDSVCSIPAAERFAVDWECVEMSAENVDFSSIVFSTILNFE
jgi:hypothetical protein